MQKMLDKEIVAFMLTITLAHRVMNTREDYQFKIVGGTNECIYHLHGAGRIYVIVQLSNDKHQRSFQFRGMIDIA